MSYFSEEIDRLLRERGKTGTEVAAAMGVSASQFSKWRRGTQTFITAGDFKRLAQTLTRNRQERASLLRAHLLDEAFLPAGHDICIKLQGGESKEKPSSAFDRAIAFLATEANANPAVRTMVINIAETLGWQPGRKRFYRRKRQNTNSKE